MFRVCRIFLVISFLCVAGMLWFAPILLKGQGERALREAGFAHASIGHVSLSTREIVFSDIQLDSDGFSTIGQIAARFDIMTLLKTGQADSLVISNVSLTALMAHSGAFSLAGWQMPPFQPILLPVSDISFENVILDLDTIHGALRFEVTGTAQLEQDGTLDFQAVLSGRQAQLVLDSVWNGGFTPEGAWFLDIVLREGKAELGDIRAGRLGGWISVAGGGDSPVQAGGQILAGTFGYGVLPFQNLVLTLDAEDGSWNVIADAHAAGVPEITASVDMGYKEGRAYGRGRVHVSGSGALGAALRASDLPPETIRIFERVLLSGFQVNAEYLEEKHVIDSIHSFILKVQDTQSILAIESHVTLDLLSGMVSGTVHMPPTNLVALERVVPLGRLTGGWTPVGGSLAIGGEWFMSSAEDGSMTLSGPVHLDLRDISLKGAEGWRMTGANGRLVFAHIAPVPLFAGVQSLSIETLRAGVDLTRGRVAIESVGGDGTLSVRGGFEWHEAKIEVDPVFFGAGASDPQAVLRARIRGIDLARLAERAQQKDFEISGILDGTILFDPNDPQGATIRDARLTNRHSGVIRYAPQTYPPFLAGSEPRLETTRNALRNFLYDHLELTISGALSGDMRGTLSARGTNPVLFGQRPIHVTLGLEGALPALLRSGAP